MWEIDHCFAVRVMCSITLGIEVGFNNVCAVFNGSDMLISNLPGTPVVSLIFLLAVFAPFTVYSWNLGLQQFQVEMVFADPIVILDAFTFCFVLYWQWSVKEQDFSGCDRRANGRRGVEWLQNALRGSRNCCCSTLLSNWIGQKIIDIGQERHSQKETVTVGGKKIRDRNGHLETTLRGLRKLYSELYWLYHTWGQVIGLTNVWPGGSCLTGW